MISADDFDAYSKAVADMSDGLAKRVEESILAWMAEHPEASVSECREFAKEVMGGMAQVADDAAATLAAEWYDAQARAAGARLESAVTASVYSPELVDDVARYQAKKLLEGDRQGFARCCAELVRNDALKSLNETIIANVGRDGGKGVRFARVMTGAENCAFCLMLASRGAVYKNRKTAGELRRFHRGCDCKVVPGFEDDPMAVLVEGHDPKRLYDAMKAIERETGLSFSDKKELSLISKDISLRSPEWILRGEIPEIEYVDQATKEKKLKDKDHPAELRVAERLRLHGYRTVFVDDERRELNEEGEWKVVGYPDLDSRLEIKNVSTASSENTISKHIGKSKKTKRGLAAIVIDVSENDNLTDEKAREMIRNSLRRHSMKSAMMITHDKSIETIYR